MSLRINTNVAALQTHRQLVDTDNRLSVSLERLSSGYRINHAKDDVSGLAISNKLNMEIKSLGMAQQNASQAQSVLQVAEGGTNQIEAITERLKELATSAASDNTDAAGRSNLNGEATSLLAEIDRIANSTKYGDTALLSGVMSFTFQIGYANSSDDQINISTTSGLTKASLGLTGLNLTTTAGAQSALTSIENSLTSINVVTGQIGAAQSRLEFASANLAISVENLSASQSAIRDVDMAGEMTNLTRNQILLQAGTAMLAQANTIPQTVLSLLK